MTYRATTAVQAATLEEARVKASEQFREFFGGRQFEILDARATAIGTVAGTVIAWDVVFDAEG